MTSESFQAGPKWETRGRPLNLSLDTCAQIKLDETSAALTSDIAVGALAAQFARNLEYFRQLFDGRVTVTLNVSFQVRPRPEIPSSPKHNLKDF